MLDRARLGVEDKAVRPGMNRPHPACHDRRGYCAKCRAVREVDPPAAGVLECPSCGSPLERTGEAGGC